MLSGVAVMGSSTAFLFITCTGVPHKNSCSQQSCLYVESKGAAPGAWGLVIGTAAAPVNISKVCHPSSASVSARKKVSLQGGPGRWIW